MLWRFSSNLPSYLHSIMQPAAAASQAEATVFRYEVDLVVGSQWKPKWMKGSALHTLLTANFDGFQLSEALKRYHKQIKK